MIRESLKEHWLALGLSVITAILVASPQVYFRIDHAHDGVYQGVELLPDSPWAARVREVQDGHPTLGSIYFKEGKNDPYLFQPLGSMIVGYLGKAFSLDINNTLLLARIVFTVASFLLIYAFTIALWRNKTLAVAAASLLLLADSVMSVWGVSEVLHGRSPDDFLRIGRPVYPALIYISLFSYLTAFFRFYKTQKLHWGLVSAALLGLNFYTYFYSWTYLYAFGGLLGVLLLLQRRWRMALGVAGVYIGAAALSLPYWINIYQASLYSTYAETGARYGVVLTHAPVFVGFVVLLALAVFCLWFPKEDRERYLFALALLLAPFVTMNQQLITGKVLQAAHYHWFFHKPMALIIILIAVVVMLARHISHKYIQMFLAALITCSVGTGIFVQAYSYVYGHENRDGGEIAVERQRFGPALSWLATNAEKEDVVFANNEFSHLTTIYTPQNVFFHRAGIYSLEATQERLLATLYLFYRLRGISAADAPRVFSEERGSISSSIYGMQYREENGAYGDIPDEVLKPIIEGYQATLSVPLRDWVKKVLTTYDVEYVVWDRRTDPEWVLDRFPYLRQKAMFGDIVIYRAAL